MKNLSIAEIARVAGVAPATVSRALNKSGYVAPRTREKIMETVQALGYRRNRIARSLRTRNSNFVGFIIPDISNEYFSMLAKEVETALRAKKYALFLCNTDENEKLEEFYVNSLLDNQVAAVIIAAAGTAAPKILADAQLPVVFVDRFMEDIQGEKICCIYSNNEAGGENAVQTLYAKGAKKILLIGDDRHIYGAENRICAAQVQAVSLNIKTITRFMHVSFLGGYHTVKNLLQEKEQFDGIFCATDTLALGALRAACECGFCVPDDIQIIGFDGINIGAYVNPALTTYKQDVIEMGKSIVQAVLQLLNDQPVDPVIKLPVTLIERETTKPL